MSSTSTCHDSEIAKVKKRVAISVIAQTAGQLFVGGLGVLVLKIMTNSLGPELYGIYATALAFTGTFALFTSLGITTITVREISKSPEKAEEIISHNIGLRLVLSAIVVPCISLAGLIVYPHATADLRLAILLMSCYLFLDAIWSTSVTYFSAKVRSDITAAILSGYQTLFLVVVGSVSLIGFGLFGYIAAYLFSVAAGAALAFVMVRKHVAIRPRGNIRIWKKIFGMSIALGMVMVINHLYFKADSIMLSVLADTKAVGLYGVAYSLVGIFLFIPGYLMGSLTPAMSTAKDKQALVKIVQKSFHLLAAVGVILPVICYIVRKDIVLLVSSPEFISAASPFAILMLGTAFSYMTTVFTSASVALDKHRKLLYVSSATLALNIMINLITIPRFGIIGAAWATAITELFSLVAVYFLFRAQTGIFVNVATVIRPVIAALAVLAVVTTGERFLPQDPLLHAMTIGASAIGLYAVTLYIIGGMPEDIKQFIQRGISLFKENCNLSRNRL